MSLVNSTFDSLCLQSAVALPLPGLEASQPDVGDRPAVLLGGDCAAGLEVKALLQARGFDVMSGPDLVAEDQEPIVVVMAGCLSDSRYRNRLDRTRAYWPTSPVFTVHAPTDAGPLLVLASV